LPFFHICPYLITLQLGFLPWKKSRLKCKMIRKYGRKVVDMRNNMENLEEREVE
jgi:hypothetical protein